MEVSSFDEIRSEFMSRVQQAVYCNVATVDSHGRPRSRVMHLVWEGPTGWVVTDPASHKAKHLENHPHVSIAYLSDPMKPVYVECTAEWITETDEQWRVWEFYKTIPLGFDLTPHYGTIGHKYFGLLRFTPWRVELAELWKESLIWRPG